MTVRDGIAGYFDRKSDSFDAIYSGQKSWTGRCWDRLTRRNVLYRHAFTIQAGAPWAGKRVLDVGCGTGRYALEIVSAGAASYVGVDLSENMLHLARVFARQRGIADKCQFLMADVRDIPTTEGFDTIVANGFFDYIADPGHVLAHLSWLRPERLIATFPARWAVRPPLRYCWLRAHGCYVRFYGRKEIEELCAQCRLSVRRLDRKGPIYLLLARPA